MSNPDSFIDEVTEEVRRDRLFGLFRKYGWIPVLLVVLVVAGAAWTEWTKARDRAAAQQFGDAVMTALENNDAAARLAALETVSAEGGRAAVLDLLTAASAVAAEDRAAALAAYAALEADAGLPESYRQLAALKRLILAGAETPAPEREAALQALARPGAPFRPLALEQLALLQLEQGQTETAIAGLRALLQEPLATAGLRRRVSQLMVALGADPAAETVTEPAGG